MKVINNKVAVTGAVHPEFEGVPVPLYLPFGYYPLSKGRHSGLLQTTFTVTEDRGIGLEGFGYYHVINDYIDVTLRGNLYSYGSWSANITPSYRRLYRYAGALNFGVQHTKFNFKGDPDFNKAKTFALSWNHTVDQKARPGTNFGANVNVQSSKYNRLIANDPRRNFQNQLSSSIAYSKNWIGKPYNLTLSANHDQNNATRLMNVRLPDAGFSVTTLFPFERKEAIGAPKWYEKAGIGYSGAFKNQFSFYDTAFDFKKVLDTLQWGASHQIPISLPLPPLGPFIVSPSIGYQEQWIMRKYDLDWNPALKKVDTTNQTGFYTARQITTGIGFNTAVYGTVLFKNSRIIALRHTLRPNFGFSYTPNLAGKYWDKVQFDTTGRVLEYSQFSGNLFTGGFNNRRFGGINFGVDNNLEMKVRSRKDTGVAAIKKIRLIDGFSINSGYNFLEDSFQLNDVTASLRSTLFDKINLNMNANLSPYQVDAFGRRINRYQWKGEGFKPGRLTN
jgi:lipopolysaccharide assembly outer membrane protein LptD (OstA)